MKNKAEEAKGKRLMGKGGFKDKELRVEFGRGVRSLLFIPKKKHLRR